MEGIMNNIYFVGFMGTGKTTVAKIFAGKLGLKFVEMDEEIEKKDGRLIVDIFSQSGEDYFRGLEREALKMIAKQKDTSVSCGGGIVINRDNLSILKESGTVICLEAEPGDIFERTRGSSHRPLLNVEDPMARITEMINARRPYYRQADYVVDTSGISPDKVADKIIRLLKDDKKIADFS